MSEWYIFAIFVIWTLAFLFMTDKMPSRIHDKRFKRMVNDEIDRLLNQRYKDKSAYRMFRI